MSVTALLAALLLGLRHATDPDHLTAVSTLVLSDARDGARRASLLGLCWGLGHAVTLFVFGLPVVLFHRYLPDTVHRAAEAAIGIVIVMLAARLLVRWHRGDFHAQHPAHPARPARPARPVPARLGSFGIGLLHGAGGSAGVGVLVVGAVPGRVSAIAALVVFAGATALSMALLSTAFGRVLAHGAVTRRLTRMVPVLAAASLMFGVWYAWGALP